MLKVSRLKPAPEASTKPGTIYTFAFWARVIIAVPVSGLVRASGGALSFATLSLSAQTSAEFGTFGAQAVVAVFGYIGFEQAPVLGAIGEQDGPMPAFSPSKGPQGALRRRQ